MEAKVFNRLKPIESFITMINFNGSEYFDNEIQNQEELINDLYKLKNNDIDENKYFELLKKCYYIKFNEDDYTEISKRILNTNKINKAFVKSSIIEKSIGEKIYSKENVISKNNYNFINIYLSSNKKDKIDLCKTYSYEDIKNMLNNNRVVLIDYKLNKPAKTSKINVKDNYDKTATLPFLSFHYSHNINNEFPLISNNLKQYIKESLTPELVDNDINKLKKLTKKTIVEISNGLINKDTVSNNKNYSKEEMLKVCDRHIIVLSKDK